MKKLLSAFFMLFFLQTVVAQFPDDIPYQSTQTPTDVSFPNYLESVIDDSVSNPIEITRITKPEPYTDNAGNPQIWYPTHEYAKTQVWNADQSLFRILSWRILDATTYQEVQSLTGDIYPSYWSNTNPDLIWSFKENGDIKKYTVSTSSTETVANLAGYVYVKLGPGEGNIDKNDHYVALVGKKANGDLDVIVYDLQNLQIVTIKTFVGAWDDGEASFPKYIDWVSVSQSGDYVVIMWNHNTATDDGVNQYIENGNLHYGVEVYNTTDMQYQHRITRYGNHGDLGYAVDGSEVLVQFYGQNNGGNLYMHKLDGSASNIVLATDADFDTNYGGGGHVSCRNINRPGWAYVTLSTPEQSGQIVAVKLDETATFEHFGHHFSSDTSYDQSAMAVASPDGKKICFKSDFGTGPNTDPSVAYIFISEVASQLNVADNEISNISVYPNPVKSVLNIHSKTAINQVEIYSIYGQLIKKINPNSISIKMNLDSFTKGIYLVNLTDIKGNVSNSKIMIK